MDEIKINAAEVPREVAEVEFSRFVTEWDIDDNVEFMPADDRESFEVQKSRILRAIASGRATVTESGQINLTLITPVGTISELIFSLPKGAAFIAMDQHKERQSVHKMYAFLGAMTKQPPKLFSNMDGRDTKFCMGIASLFLGS